MIAGRHLHDHACGPQRGGRSHGSFRQGHPKTSKRRCRLPRHIGAESTCDTRLMSEREVGSLVLLVAGLAILAATIWARRGGSSRARRWMYTPPPPSDHLHDERVVIF